MKGDRPFLKARGRRRTPISEYFDGPWGGLSGCRNRGAGLGRWSRLERWSAPDPLARCRTRCRRNAVHLVFSPRSSRRKRRNERHRARGSGANQLSSLDHLPTPAPLFLHPLRPPQGPSKYSETGVRRLARSPANSQAKIFVCTGYRKPLFSTNSETSSKLSVRNLSTDSECPSHSDFDILRSSIYRMGKMGGGSVTVPPGPTTSASVPAGHSDELQLPDQIPF